jgi:hypothetical protein
VRVKRIAGGDSSEARGVTVGASGARPGFSDPPHMPDVQAIRVLKPVHAGGVVVCGGAPLIYL